MNSEVREAALASREAQRLNHTGKLRAKRYSLSPLIPR